MANATVNLSLTTSGYVDSSRPYTVITTNTSTEYEITENSKLMYFGMEKMPNALKHNVLISFSATLACKGYATIGIDTSKDGFNPSTLTYNNKPASNGEGYFWVKLNSETISNYTVSTNTNKTYLANLFKHNTIVVRSSSSSIRIPTIKTVLANGSTRPYFTITYDNATKVTSQIAVTSGPTSGYSNPRTATTFQWDYERVGTDLCADDTFDQSSAVFYWKNSTDESYTSVSVSGNTKGVTIPANTFPTASTIQWYVSGTDEDNTTTQTEVFSFSTAAATVVTDPIYPVNTVESNNQPITFRWSYSSADGLPPSSLALMWKLTSGDSWTTIVTLTNAETSYTVQANTIPAGEIRWGVHPYNIDGVSGTGHTATYISYGAPDAPVVYAENVPFSTVTWQSSDQQAYKIMVDDTVYGPYFGTEKSFELPDYLRDGTHVIKVSVCGTYALWSDWGQTTITIQNVPGDDVSLDIEAATDVQLMIETQDSDPTFLIYRDGVLVGKTNRNQFTDRFALGEHTYQVVNKLANGNYSISNETNGTANVQNANIALLEGGEWLEIKFNPKDQSDPQYTDSIMASYNHLSGAEFPSATVSPYRDLTVEYSAVFLYTQQEERKRFESMFKKPVVIKFKDGTVFVGILGSWAKMPFRHFYTAYTFTVTQIDFEDYIDDTE